MAGHFVDFYALLDVASDASAEVLRAAVSSQRKLWESARDEATDTTERDTAWNRLRDLDVAEYVLLDPEQRAEYDEEWHERRTAQALKGSEGSSGSNGTASMSNGSSSHAGGTATTTEEPRTEREDDSKGRGKGKGASKKVPAIEQATAERAEATQEKQPAARGDASGEDWATKAREALSAGDQARAIDSFHYAIMLHPGEIGLHYELGQAYVGVGNFEQALGAFESAGRLAPNVPEYRAAVGNALVHLGRPGDAVGVLEQVVAEVPTEARYRAELAQALHDTCVHEMTQLSDGMVCITTAEQATLVERLTGRALSLLDPADHSQLAEDVREKHRLAKLAHQRVWRPPLPLWLMISFTVVICGGFALFVTWWTGLIGLVVLGIVGFVLGLQPTWWHVAREARATGMLAEH